MKKRLSQTAMNYSGFTAYTQMSDTTRLQKSMGGAGMDDPSESNNLSASWLFCRTLIDVSRSVNSVIVFELAIAEVFLFTYYR